jgi:MFS transporter, ACS family, tartrate transporter
MEQPFALLRTCSSSTRGSATEHTSGSSQDVYCCTDGADVTADATARASAQIFRRVHWRLLPVFCVLNSLNYLDRGNLAFASIQLSIHGGRLHLLPAQYGMGSGLFFLGHSVCQLPSQLVVRKVGAPYWLSFIVAAWGITACCMAAVTGEASFYAVRTLLGAAEAGSRPAYWYYLAGFYPDSHIALPYAITESAIMVTQVRAVP